LEDRKVLEKLAYRRNNRIFIGYLRKITGEDFSIGTIGRWGCLWRQYIFYTVVGILAILFSSPAQCSIFNDNETMVTLTVRVWTLIYRVEAETEADEWLTAGYHTASVHRYLGIQERRELWARMTTSTRETPSGEIVFD
jgi:hypothetical protein